MLAGNALLGVVAITIFMGPSWTLTFKDALFWVVVVAVLVVRYIDIFRYDGKTAEMKPATPRDFRRYAIGLVITCAALWTCAQSVQLVAS
jgi:hypothetical protein